MIRDGRSRTDAARPASCIDIVIVNWNSGDYLRHAVESIREHHDGLVATLTIVDNASTDDSLERALLCEDSVFATRVIRNTENVGFGVACNAGAAVGTAEHLLFLNPDAALMDGTLRESDAYLRRHDASDVDIVGVPLIDESGAIARSCARFPSTSSFVARIFGLERLPGLGALGPHMIEWAHDETRTVDHVIGAYFFVRRRAFERLGGFDERFFVYLEDLDFSLRVHQLGHRSVFVDGARAFHAGGGTSRQIKTLRSFYSLRSRIQYAFKHFPTPKAWALLVATVAFEPATRSLFEWLRGDGESARNALRAHTMLVQELPNILSARGAERTAPNRTAKRRSPWFRSSI